MTMFRLASMVSTLLVIATVVILSNPIACSSSNVDGSTRLTVSNLGKSINLSSGMTEEISFPVTVNSAQFPEPFSAITLNLKNHLSALTVSGTTASIPFPLQAIKMAQAAIEGTQLFLRVANIEQLASVCTDGEVYGPFSVTLADTLVPMSVSPETASATQQTLDVINTGSYAVCIQILPVVNATVDLDTIIVNTTNCTEAPADIAGDWTGPYSCLGTCPENGTVMLTIVQNLNDPSIATYTDNSGASYEGRVCGSRFSYSGGVTSDYDESGTFVLNPDGSASKTSQFIDLTTGFCTGSCSDELTRM